MRIHPGLLIVCALFGCSEDDSGAVAPAELRLFAFPNAVEPGGQTTIAVALERADCGATASACTVCLGMPLTEGGGQLFGPPGLDVSGGPRITLTIDSDASRKLLESLTYIAPNHEGSEVVSASAFRGKTSCEGSNPPETLLASSTVRIQIRKPSPASDTGGSAGSAPLGGEGGAPQGGTGGDAGGGAGNVAGSGGQADLAGAGGA